MFNLKYKKNYIYKVVISWFQTEEVFFIFYFNFYSPYLPSFWSCTTLQSDEGYKQKFKTFTETIFKCLILVDPAADKIAPSFTATIKKNPGQLIGTTLDSY